MAAGPVTDAERARAKAQARATGKLERKSSNAATKLGTKMFRKSLSAWKQGRADKIRVIVSDEFRKVEPILTELMVVAYLTGLDRIRQAKKDAAGPAAIAAALHSDAVRALTERLQVDPARLSEIVKRQKVEAVRVLKRESDAIDRKLQRSILRINQEGLTVTEGTKELRKTFASAGITPANAFEIEAVFRTQTQFAYGAGAWGAAQDPVIDEILQMFKYITVGDGRVRDNHAALDGTTAKKDDPIWQTIWTPNGWACRCQILFIFEERKTVLPEAEVDKDGRTIIPGPDPGFAFNPGTILNPSGGSIRRPQAIGKKVRRV